MPNLHPLVVHFPMGLLLTSIVLYWANLFWKGRGLEQAYWYTHRIGLAGALFAVISGLLAARTVPADSPAISIVSIHRALGLATFVVFGLLAVCHARNKGEYSRGKRILHTIVQWVGVGLILAAGFFGGELVYTFGVGVAAP